MNKEGDRFTQEKFSFMDSSDTEEDDEVGDESDRTEDQSLDPVEEPRDFQEALERLKDSAQHLESGELPLEEAMERYREGLSLISYCEDRLEDAELLVQEIEDTDAGEPEVREKKDPES